MEATADPSSVSYRGVEFMQISVRRRIRRLAVPSLFLSFLLAGTIASAQTATITGVVSDASGGAVPETAVTARNAGTSAVRTATTDASGAYTLSNLPVGH